MNNDNTTNNEESLSNIDRLLPKCPKERMTMEIEAYDKIIEDAIRFKVGEDHLNRYKRKRDDLIEERDCLVIDRVSKDVKDSREMLQAIVVKMENMEKLLDNLEIWSISSIK